MAVKFRPGKRRPKWVVDFSDAEGKRRYLTLYTIEEANQFNETMRREAQRRKRKELSTFAEIGKNYIDVTRPFVKPQTADLYARVLRQHVYPEIGDQLVVSLTRSDIKTFLASKLEGGLKAKSVMTIQSAVKGVFDTAIDSEIVGQNPAAGLQRFIRRGSNILAGPIKAMTSVQLDRFLDVAEQTEPKFYPIFLTLARTGMRIGEAITLQWEDLDFEERTIRVARSMTIACVIDTPKNGRERQVDMSSQLSEVLARPSDEVARGQDTLPV